MEISFLFNCPRLTGGACLECCVEKDPEAASRLCGEDAILISDVWYECRERLVMSAPSTGPPVSPAAAGGGCMALTVTSFHLLAAG